MGLFNPLIVKHSFSVVFKGFLQSVSLVGILEGTKVIVFFKFTMGLDLNITQNTTHSVNVTSD